MIIALGNGKKAVRLACKQSETMRGPIETWVIREMDETPILQLQTFQCRGAWVAWTGNLIRPAQRAEASAFETARNLHK